MDGSSPWHCAAGVYTQTRKLLGELPASRYWGTDCIHCQGPWMQWQFQLDKFSSFCVWPCVFKNSFLIHLFLEFPAFNRYVFFCEMKMRRQKRKKKHLPLHLSSTMPRPWPFPFCPLGFSCEDGARMWPKWLLSLSGWFPRSVPWFPPPTRERSPSFILNTSFRPQPTLTSVAPESRVAASDLNHYLYHGSVVWKQDPAAQVEAWV